MKVSHMVDIQRLNIVSVQRSAIASQQQDNQRKTHLIHLIQSSVGLKSRPIDGTAQLTNTPQFTLCRFTIHIIYEFNE